MKPRVILNKTHFELTLKRLCHQLIENHDDFSNSIIVGLQPRGIFLSRRIVGMLNDITKQEIKYGELDITFHRDDFRRNPEVLTASKMDMDVIVENKKVVLVDDVLFTGRTIRAGLDALLAFGRPKKVELLALIDRRYSRHLPIHPDYVGKIVDSVASEKVKVEWDDLDGGDQVLLFTVKKEDD